MKKIKNKKFIKIAIIISIPVLLISQYYLFKFGILRPIIKGTEIKIVGGEYISDIDKYVIKLDDTLELSMGDFITIPPYSKDPELFFKVLDNNQIVSLSRDEDGFKLTALNEGYTSIGIMNKSNLLKKVAIKVVNPKVENLEIELDENLVYVGDESEIKAKVETDYKDFKEPDVEYSSSNKSVLDIKDNIVKAIGVGSATIYAESGGMVTPKTVNIRAKVSSIKIDKKIEIEEGQVIKLKPQIITSPKGLKHPKIEYTLVGAKIPISRAIEVDNYGTITGVQEGEEQIKISCGEKSEIVTIKVNKKSIRDKVIENLIVIEEIVDDNMLLTLSWDHIDGVKDYKVYLRNNSLGEKEFSEIKNISINSENQNNKVQQTTISINIKDLTELDLDMYVVGESDDQQTNPSSMINRKYSIDTEDINNLNGYFDDSTNSIRISWDPIKIEGATYSVYKRDLLKGETEFTLHNDEITVNECIINTVETQVEMEVFITASYDGKVITSKTITIK